MLSDMRRLFALSCAVTCCSYAPGGIMPTWWTGLADAPPDEAQALHPLGLGFMAARTLHVALELRLFTHLAAGAQTLAHVAQALGLAERAAGRLLYACTALGPVPATRGIFV